MFHPVEIEQQILKWAKDNKESWQSYDEAYDIFVYRVESWDDVVLPAGEVNYVELQQDEDGATFVFEVNGNHYALTGSYSSWGSDWDSDVSAVEKYTVTLERWRKTD